MNYYPFHLGDYTAHTAHLEPLEDLAYRRMLDAYYLREGPLPVEVADVARLIRMRQNLAEVELVLREFFQLSADGWRHARCDEEIERMQARQAAAEEKTTHERDRMRRHRERRAELFDDLRQVGITPAWDVPITELQRLHSAHCKPPETGLKREQVISGDGPATAIPTPTPTPTPVITPLPPAEGQWAEPAPRESRVSTPETIAGDICKALKLAGIGRVNPSHQRLQMLVQAGATVADFRAHIPAAKEKGEPFSWLLAAVEAERKRAAAVLPTLHKGPLPRDVVGPVAESFRQRDMRDSAARMSKLSPLSVDQSLLPVEQPRTIFTEGSVNVVVPAIASH